ncbi:hypothetical protein CDD83_752 [Cordyceps sp. RAO-2017]|nr:hypothetical protein CDD83_752 [Cordyceps sp. RAO-2017]
MTISVPRRMRRRIAPVALALALALSIWYVAQPLDSPARLALRFNLGRLAAKAVGGDGWLRGPARHRLDLRSDVGYIIKTGYGTRDRLPEQLEALGHGILGDEGRGFLVVGDWTTVNETDGRRLGVDVHDAVRMVMETKIDDEFAEHPRFSKYRSLQGTVAAGDEDKAKLLGQTYGWELDALKFIMGLELAYRRLPLKKWYMILDDDTYLVRPSLELLLSHLDPSKPRYIGNAVGDYKGRFAHGGSAVLLSGAAMKVLFERPDVVARAYVDSLDETWGDRLVATTLQKVGIYMEERYGHHFNGESPEMSRIRADRVCSPVVSFHGLRRPGAMASVGRKLGWVAEPVLWGQLWELFGEQPMERYGRRPSLPGDHVGPRDEHTKSWKGVSGDEACRTRCEGSGGGWCLAWTFERETNECHGSPWVMVGQPGGGGGRPATVSGVNWKRMERLLQQCLPPR